MGNTSYRALEKNKNIVNSMKHYRVVKPCKVSKRLEVPDHILKPEYYATGVPSEESATIEIKNSKQIESMRKSCQLTKYILENVKPLIQPGVTTDTIDAKIHQLIISNNAYPSPLNYSGFPKSICTSVNNVACHGIPDDRPLDGGDIINVDISVYFQGYHGDSSAMFIVDNTDVEAKRLITVTQDCLDAAIKICRPNENFSSIGLIIEEIAAKYGYLVIPSIAGHGIGSYFHGQPDIFHFAHDEPGKMLPGMTFTIEPCLSEGTNDIKVLEDGWTVVTTDDSRTAQFEHTILINNFGCEVLTK